MSDEAFLAHMLAAADAGATVTAAEVARLRRLADWADAPMPPCWSGTVDPGEVRRAVDAARLLDSVTAEHEARVKAEAERDALREALRGFLDWADRKCPCHNDLPDPCPLCGASVEGLERCKAADETLPRALLAQARAALSGSNGNG